MIMMRTTRFPTWILSLLLLFLFIYSGPDKWATRKTSIHCSSFWLGWWLILGFWVVSCRLIAMHGAQNMQQYSVAFLLPITLVYSMHSMPWTSLVAQLHGIWNIYLDVYISNLLVYGYAGRSVSFFVTWSTNLNQCTSLPVSTDCSRNECSSPQSHIFSVLFAWT